MLLINSNLVETEKDKEIIRSPTILPILDLSENSETVPILYEIIGAIHPRHPPNPDSDKLHPFVISKLKVGDNVIVLR